MSSNPSPMDRLKVLDGIEKDVLLSLQHAGNALAEMGKEKQTGTGSWKQADAHIQSFMKTLSSVENNMSSQINYLTQVSTGQPHEGSGYAAQKVVQMAWHRLEHAKSRINELEAIKNKHLVDKIASVNANRLQQLTQQSQQQPQQTQQSCSQIKPEPF